MSDPNFYIQTLKRNVITGTYIAASLLVAVPVLCAIFDEVSEQNISCTVQETLAEHLPEPDRRRLSTLIIAQGCSAGELLPSSPE